MGYRTPLEAKIAKKTTKAIVDFNLVEDGDRIMVGLSGGKDSWALIQILDVLRQRAPIDFSIVAVNVDSGYEGYQHTQVAAAFLGYGLQVGLSPLMERVLKVRIPKDQTYTDWTKRPLNSGFFQLSAAAIVVMLFIVLVANTAAIVLRNRFERKRG